MAVRLSMYRGCRTKPSRDRVNVGIALKCELWAAKEEACPENLPRIYALCGRIAPWGALGGQIWHPRSFQRGVDSMR